MRLIFAAAFASMAAIGPVVSGGGGVTDAADFAVWQGATGATPVAPFPNVGAVGTPYAHDGLVFTLGPGATQLFVGSGSSLDWTTRTAGHDLGISALEDFNVDIAGGAYAIGFEFVEPEFDPNLNAPFVESTFEATLYNGSALVGSVQFSRPNDSLQFVGLSSDAMFDRLEIREVVGGFGNEFFGQFFIATGPGCPGDLDGDGDVDFGDLNALLGNFNTTGAGLVGDLDGDGDVDFADLNTLLGVFNTLCP